MLLLLLFADNALTLIQVGQELSKTKEVGKADVCAVGQSSNRRYQPLLTCCCSPRLCLLHASFEHH
jgi:hypothetical protein